MIRKQSGKSKKEQMWWWWFKETRLQEREKRQYTGAKSQLWNRRKEKKNLREKQKFAELVYRYETATFSIHAGAKQEVHHHSVNTVLVYSLKRTGDTRSYRGWKEVDKTQIAIHSFVVRDRSIFLHSRIPLSRACLWSKYTTFNLDRPLFSVVSNTCLTLRCFFIRYFYALLFFYQGYSCKILLRLVQDMQFRHSEINALVIYVRYSCIKWNS